VLRYTDLGLKLFDKVRLKSCKISLDRSFTLFPLEMNWRRVDW